MEPASPTFGPESRQFNRPDTAWLTFSFVFLGVLAALPPQFERHKAFILLTIGVLQFMEKRIVRRFATRGVSYVLLLKILLATLLVDHTGEVGINSSYYPIYYLPVVTAAFYCGPWTTMLWTLIASAFYCSYLYPVMPEYALTLASFGHLAVQVLCLFLVAMAVNRSRNIVYSGTA